MAVIKYFIIFIISFNVAYASTITQAFKRKDYKRVSEIYRLNQKKNFSTKELVIISFSLRKLGFYRQDIKLNIRLVRKLFAKHHRKLLKEVKDGDVVEGDEYPKQLKVLYWNLMNDYGKIIESYKDVSTLIKKDHEHYLTFSKLLSELEFREKVVDKFNDRIMSHLQYLQDKVYKFSSSISLQYISWQSEALLQGPSGKAELILTNRGFCAGGDLGIENAFYHFYFDGCVFTGAGGVSSDADSPTTYSQSNVPAYGVKMGPGVSKIVSPSGSRIGLKLPLIYSVQPLEKPPQTGYSIETTSPLSVVGTIYSRWQFESWYFQTEFGKYLQAEQTFWGLGIGKKF